MHAGGTTMHRKTAPAESTRSRVDATRGERFAEAYARRYADVIWESYLVTFAL
jgi:hypothetical protein